jgi:hypothetical protein
MRLTFRLVVLCLVATTFPLLAAAQNQKPALTTDQDLKQRFSRNHADFDELRKFSNRFENPNSAGDKEVKKFGAVDPELQQIVKRLHVMALASFADGDVEIVVDEHDGTKAGYLFSPGRKNHVDEVEPYTLLKSLGDDWFVFRKT